MTGCFPCKVCNEYTLAPDGEGHCSRGTCIFAERVTNIVGKKYDEGKPRLAEMIQDFRLPLIEVAKVWAFGADKYDKGNWRYVLGGEERYTNALMRHLVAEADTQKDDESELMHAAHVAWNALARLHFLIEKEKKDNGEKIG